MKVNESWLRTLVDPPLDIEAIGAALTMAGLEVDGIEPTAPEFSGVVVARIESLEPHPDADKLRVCHVDAGDGDLRQVICGAANAAAGMTVALAQVGAVLPGGVKIRKAKLRGVESFGMLCSASELGLEESSSGIMALPASAPLGEDLRDWLSLDDAVLDIDLTPNRADCFSVLGVARELAVITGEPLKAPEISPVAPVSEATFPVSIEAGEACPNYAGRVIQGVDPKAETPLWMKERLRRCGIRSLGPTVDVTNYVMLELGQPMHAFDMARLDRGIVVRFAEPGEKLTLLDGGEVDLKAETLIIADQAQPLALAGIMGGEASAVTESTVDLFLESAFFRPEIIAGKAREYGLHTESSHRFERGVDFRLQTRAIERATALIVEICGGEPGPVTVAESSQGMPRIEPIALRRQRVPKLLGIEMEDAAIEQVLTGLGCEIEFLDDGWRVTPPSFRFDLRIEADLVEELARIHGYDNIPSHSRSWAPAIEKRPETQAPVARLKTRLNELGYQEVITYSFVDPKWQETLEPNRQSMALANPISSDLAVMRTTLWGGLLNTVRHNQRRQQPRVRIFESGLVFLPEGGELKQVNRIGGAISGDVAPEQWGQPARQPDFFDIKGDVERLLSAATLENAITWKPASHPALHPGQSAELFHGEQSIGLVGALHPAVQSALDLDRAVYLFELDSGALAERKLPAFEPLPKYPSVRRDLALVVDQEVTWGQVANSLASMDASVIADFRIFDVYQGEGVGTGRKSLALSLILQDFSSTLSEEEVERVVDRVLKRLHADTGATLRE